MHLPALDSTQHKDSLRYWKIGGHFTSLEDQVAATNPDRRPELLEQWFLFSGPGSYVAYLEKKNVFFDPTRFDSFLERVFRYFGQSNRVTFLVERRLEYLERENRHAEAWDFATNASPRLVPIDRYEGRGLLGEFYNVLKRQKHTGEHVRYHQSVLNCVERKLDLLSCSEDICALGISYPFRLFLSESLTIDPDLTIIWITVRKHSSEFRVRRDLLIYWSRYFSTMFSGRWANSSCVNFDKDDNITSQFVDKIFGRYITTGMYTWTGLNDFESDYEAARYLRMDRLEDMLRDKYVCENGTLYEKFNYTEHI